MTPSPKYTRVINCLVFGKIKHLFSYLCDILVFTSYKGPLTNLKIFIRGVPDPSTRGSPKRSPSGTNPLDQQGVPPSKESEARPGGTSHRQVERHRGDTGKAGVDVSGRAVPEETTRRDVFNLLSITVDRSLTYGDPRPHQSAPTLWNPFRDQDRPGVKGGTLLTFHVHLRRDGRGGWDSRIRRQVSDKTFVFH